MNEDSNSPKEQYICTIIAEEPPQIFQVIVDRLKGEHLFLVDLRAKKHILKNHKVMRWNTSPQDPFPVAEEEQGRYPSGSVRILGELV